MPGRLRVRDLFYSGTMLANYPRDWLKQVMHGSNSSRQSSLIYSLDADVKGLGGASHSTVGAKRMVVGEQKLSVLRDLMRTSRFAVVPPGDSPESR